MKASTQKSVVTSIICLIVAAVIGVAVYAILLLTNYGTEPFRNLYLTYNGSVITSSYSKQRIRAGEKYTYGLVYLEGTAIPEDSPKYYAKIIANGSNDFSFTVDGVHKKWSDEQNTLDTIFALERGSDTISFTVPVGYDSLQAVLEALYPGQTVTNVPVEYKLPYKLVVSSHNETCTYTIAFDVEPEGSLSLELDKDRIIF